MRRCRYRRRGTSKRTTGMRNLLRYTLLRHCFHDMKGPRPRCYNLSILYIGNNNCVYIGINYMCLRARPNCVELWTSTVYIIVTAKCNYHQSIGACRWRCCSCECPPSCSVLSSPKPWREAKIKLFLARYVLDDLDAASSSLGQAICRLVEHGNDLETCRPGPRGWRGQTTSGYYRRW